MHSQRRYLYVLILVIFVVSWLWVNGSAHRDPAKSDQSVNVSEILQSASPGPEMENYKFSDNELKDLVVRGLAGDLQAREEVTKHYFFWGKEGELMMWQKNLAAIGDLDAIEFLKNVQGSSGSPGTLPSKR